MQKVATAIEGRGTITVIAHRVQPQGKRPSGRWELIRQSIFQIARQFVQRALLPLGWAILVIDPA